jgi:hypothetical protein
MIAFLKRIFRRGIHGDLDPSLANEEPVEAFVQSAQDRLLAQAAILNSMDYFSSLNGELTSIYERLDVLEKLKVQLKTKLEIASQREDKTLALLARDRKTIGSLQVERDRVNDWIHDREQSFSFQLIKEQSNQLEAMKSQRAEAVAIIERDVDVDVAKLVDLSTKFVKSFQFSSVIPGTIALIVVGILFLPLALLGALVAGIPGFYWSLSRYHREWSRVSQKVTKAEDELQYASDVIAHTREEKERLSVLQPLLGQQLELLAHAIYRPWQVDEDFLRKEEETLQAAYLSGNVEFAVVYRGRGEMDHGGLVRHAIDEFIYTPGWRHDAFDTIGNVAVGANRFDSIDSKPGILKSLVQAIQNSQHQLFAGSTKIQELEGKLRSKIVGTAGGSNKKNMIMPRVSRVRPDPLEGLITNPNLDLGLDQKGEPWNEFLLAIADMPSMWSPLMVSKSGRVGSKKEPDSGLSKMTSYVIGPDRLKNEVKDKLPDVTYLQNASDGASPLDLLIRVDTTSEGVPPAWASLLEDSNVIVPEVPVEIVGSLHDPMFNTDDDAIEV